MECRGINDTWGEPNSGTVGQPRSGPTLSIRYGEDFMEVAVVRPARWKHLTHLQIWSPGPSSRRHRLAVTTVEQEPVHPSITSSLTVTEACRLRRMRIT